MGIEKVCGQLCWTLESDVAKVFLTIQGGNLTCEFQCGGRAINPYYVFPWWNEPISLELDGLSQGMRGDFFCFPFGMDDGDPVTYHGPTAGGIWQPLKTDTGNNATLDAAVDLDQGTVIKHVELRPGESVIYQKHTITGFTGDMPFGYHPILEFPDRPGAGLLSYSVVDRIFTTPTPVETSDTGGYSCLRPGIEIEDQKSVPCIDGSTLDVSAYPHEIAHEDIVLLVSDPVLDLAWSAVSFPQDGYLYFQLKNPSVLRQTMIWMSNGGRWYAPWNGRIKAVLGLEEITGFFHYGKVASVNPNALSDSGIPTSRLFAADESVGIPLISGIAPIGPDFGRITAIEDAGGGEIAIAGSGNEVVQVACDTSFLK